MAQALKMKKTPPYTPRKIRLSTGEKVFYAIAYTIISLLILAVAYPLI